MLSAPTFSANEYNFLNDDLSCVPWILKRESLERDKSEAERFLRDLKLSRLPSNVELAAELWLRLSPSQALPKDAERQEALKSLIPNIEEAMTRDYAAKNHIFGKILPQLKALYLYPDKSLLLDDLKAIDRVDNAKQVDDQIAEAELNISDLSKKIETHRKTVLACFRGGKVPAPSDLTSVTADLGSVPWSPERIAEYLLTKFASDWRMRAQLFPEETSVHGTSIKSMPSARRAVWMKAWEKMGLELDPTKVRYAARVEPRQPAPIKQSRGQFFEPKKVSQR